MPFKSKAQQAWMFANKPEMAKEWAAETPSNEELPQRVTTRPSQGRGPRRTKTYKPPSGNQGHQQ